MTEEWNTEPTGQWVKDGRRALAVSAQEREHELAERAKNGDDESFLELMGMMRHSMLRIALAYLRSEDAALEAIQETTCRAYAKRSGLKEPAFFRTWLLRILMNVCVDEQKRRKKQRPVGKLPDTAACAAGPAEDLRIEEAIARLAPKFRQVVALKYTEDMTLSDIAKLLGRPEGTVKTWLNRALAQLRREFGKEGRKDGTGAARFFGAD